MKKPAAGAGKDAKTTMAESIDAWVADRYGPTQMVTEYIVIAKTINIADGERPKPKYLYGWRRNADIDATTNILRRAYDWFTENT